MPPAARRASLPSFMTATIDADALDTVANDLGKLRRARVAPILAIRTLGENTFAPSAARDRVGLVSRSPPANYGDETHGRDLRRNDRQGRPARPPLR